MFLGCIFVFPQWVLRWIYSVFSHSHWERHQSAVRLPNTLSLHHTGLCVSLEKTGIIIKKETHVTWQRRRRPQTCWLLQWRQVRDRASLCATPSWRARVSLCCGGSATPPTELLWRPRPPSGRPGERRGGGRRLTLQNKPTARDTSTHPCPFHLQTRDPWHVSHCSHVTFDSFLILLPTSSVSFRHPFALPSQAIHIFHYYWIILHGLCPLLDGKR